MNIFVDDIYEYALIKQVKMGIPERSRLTTPWPLAVGKSKLTLAGLGIITNQELPCCLVFGPYQGRLVEKNVDAEESGYGWQIRKEDNRPMSVDAVDDTISNWMRYVNCPTSQEQCNLVSFQYQGQIYYKTTRLIKTLVYSTSFLDGL